MVFMIHIFHVMIFMVYIYRSGGYANRGLLYRVRHWDDNARLRKEIREYLDAQIEDL